MSQQPYQQQIDDEDGDDDVGVGSIKDYLNEIFQDERLEVARIKNQEKGDTEIIMGNVAKLLKELSWEERFEWIHQQKIKGNRFFKKEQYQEANDIYLQGLMGIEFQNTDQIKQKRMIQENILPLLTNVATTLIRLKKYDNASLVCDKVLSLDPDSIKGNCKKGESLMYCRLYDQAVVYLKKALQLAQKDIDKINILRIYKKLKIMKKNEQNVYKQMFPPAEAAKNEQEMNKLIQESKQKGLNNDEQNFMNSVNEEYDEDNDDFDSEQESCDEDEYGCEQNKIRSKQQQNKKHKSDKIKILEYNDQLETLKQYIGPLSFIMIYPIKIYKKIATAIGCKRRQVNLQFESDTEDQRDDQNSNDENGSDDDEDD